MVGGDREISSSSSTLMSSCSHPSNKRKKTCLYTLAELQSLFCITTVIGRSFYWAEQYPTLR